MREPLSNPVRAIERAREELANGLARCHALLEREVRARIDLRTLASGARVEFRRVTDQLMLLGDVHPPPKAPLRKLERDAERCDEKAERHQAKSEVVGEYLQRARKHADGLLREGAELLRVWHKLCESSCGHVLAEMLEKGPDPSGKHVDADWVLAGLLVGAEHNRAWRQALHRKHGSDSPDLEAYARYLPLLRSWHGRALALAQELRHYRL